MSNDKVIASIIDSQRAERAADKLELYMKEFRAKLEKTSEGVLEEICITIDDISADSPIRKADLPPSIPLALREEILQRSKRIIAEQRELSTIFTELSDVANKMMDQREDARENALPHCKECGQVVKAKTKRKR